MVGVAWKRTPNVSYDNNLKRRQLQLVEIASVGSILPAILAFHAILAVPTAKTNTVMVPDAFAACLQLQGLAEACSHAATSALVYPKWLAYLVSPSIKKTRTSTSF